MYLVTQISSAPLQSMNITLPDSTTVAITIYFSPQQQGWFITNLTYQTTFILNGLRITNNPNMLLQYQNQIPFGLACYSTANREPSLQEDFSSGSSQLYILDQSECQEYYSLLQNGETGVT